MRRLIPHPQRLREEDGYAVIAAVMIVFIVLGLGLALLKFTDIQQKASAREQSKETSYTLAEAALNAQISSLATQWPTGSLWSPSSPPSSCSAGAAPSTGCVCNSTATTFVCPNPSGAWISSYMTGGNLGSAYCPPRTPSDAWGGAPTTSWSTVNNSWATYVRDDGGGTGQLFNTSTDLTQPPYDANVNGSLWVRAVGVENCQKTVLINRVSEQLVPLPFPRSGVNVNAFTVTNTGNKIILDTAGIYAQPSNPNAQAGQITTRCANLSGQTCTTYRSNSQLDVDTCAASSTSPYACTKFPAPSNQTLSSSSLAALQADAVVAGTYYGPSSPLGCPTTAAQLTSPATPGGIAPVYVDTGCPNITLQGGTINSASQPGFLVLTNETLTLLGGTTFYGLIYDADLCSSGSPATWTPCTTPSTMITLGGTSTVQGALDVDGAGEILFGASGVNFIYDGRIFNSLQTYGGAAAVPNSFRVLANSQ